MSDYALALAFDTDNPEFARGVELGTLWQRLRSDEGAAEATIHVTNAEMALRVGEALGRSVVSEECDDGHWMVVQFGPSETRERT
jgi:hypothetical protein